MIGLIFAATALQVEPAERTHEGDWYVSDNTDNNTGEREVYAFQLYLKKNEPDYVTLTMRCSKGRPTFFVEWDDVAFPDQAVVTIGPALTPTSEPAEQQYIFEKSKDLIERGLRATPETSAKIISAIGKAEYATVSVHLTSGTRTVGMDVDGTPRAWSRVSRHCPIQKMPLPSL